MTNNAFATEFRSSPSQSPGFDVLADLSYADQQEWMRGFHAFFSDLDLVDSPNATWCDGWTAAIEEVLYQMHGRLPAEDASLEYRLHGVGFAAWRHVFREHGLLDALASECAPANVPEVVPWLLKGDGEMRA